MHEFAIGDSIVRSMKRIRDENGYAAVHRVTVDIGALQLVVPEALDMAFTALTNETDFAETELVQNVIPATAVCHDCGLEQVREELFEPCKNCGSYNLAMLTGMELNIANMEVEENV